MQRPSSFVTNKVCNKSSWFQLVVEVLRRDTASDVDCVDILDTLSIKYSLQGGLAGRTTLVHIIHTPISSGPRGGGLTLGVGGKLRSGIGEKYWTAIRVSSSRLPEIVGLEFKTIHVTTHRNPG